MKHLGYPLLLRAECPRPTILPLSRSRRLGAEPPAALGARGDTPFRLTPALRRRAYTERLEGRLSGLIGCDRLS